MELHAGLFHQQIPGDIPKIEDIMQDMNVVYMLPIIAGNIPPSFPNIIPAGLEKIKFIFIERKPLKNIKANINIIAKIIIIKLIIAQYFTIYFITYPFIKLF